MRKYAYIDALRAVAIILVIIVHSSLFTQDTSMLLGWAKYGQMGVQLFFVASALTLCLSMEQRGANVTKVREFYIRRFFRIAPMYYVGIGCFYSINFLQNILHYNNDLKEYTVGGILANIFFIHGFVPKYFNNIVPGGWSISTEVFFYLIFPFLYLHFSKRSWQYLLVVLFCYEILGAIGVYAISYIYPQKQFVNTGFFYCNILTQFPIFLWGILLFRVLKEGRGNYPIIGSVTFIGLFTMIFFWNAKLSISFFIVPFCAGMFFFGLSYLTSKVYRHCKILERIGQKSYSIYIFHTVFCIIFFKWINGYLLTYLLVGVNSRFVVNVVATIFFSSLLANLTERLIEKPFVRKGNLLIDKLARRIRAGN